MMTLRNIAVWGLFGLPLCLQANSSGAPPGSSGVPGELTCAQSGCHVGGLNPSGGSVAVTFPGGLTYTPGMRQTLTVTVTDPVARGFGFQLTVRSATNNKTSVGGLFTGPGTIVLCASGDFTRESDKMGTCPANQPIESVTHDSVRRAPTNTWTMSWEPPATAQGNVIVYVAGNGANLNGQNSGDRIFTTNYTLTPAAGGGGGGPRPTISDGGIVQAGSFGASRTVAAGSWIEIFGTNFATSSGDWGQGFTGNNAPTTTNGVSVTIGGSPAFISFVAPGQINAQVPADVGAGPTAVIVKNANGDSNTLMLTTAARTPGLLSPPVFRVGGNQYLAAFFPDNVTFVGPTGFIAGVNSRPARAGDVIITYGVGFGAVSPNNPPGVITTAANALPNFTARFGQVNATVGYAGLAAGFVGLYQFNITVPAGVTGNAVAFTVTTDGVPLAQSLVTAVQ